MSKKVTYKDFQILKAIPAKGKVSTTHILETINKQGFELNKRTVQRDLNNLSEFFAIASDGNKDVAGWYWREDAQKLELPVMSPDVALTFKMTQNYLTQFMPPNVLAQLQPYLKQANTILNSLDNSLNNWQDKINTTSRVLPLIPPKIKSEHIEIIYQSLLKEKQLKTIYRPIKQKKKEYIMHPLGVVIVDQILYLVATLWDYEDVLQFPLHRFIDIEELAENSKKIKDFNLNNYIKQGNFLFPDKQETSIDLVLIVNQYLAQYLAESKLATNQKITKIKDDNFKITATVQLSQQLKWWLLSQGDDIEVLKPKKLRDYIKKVIINSYKKYE
ncbi:transcriptional factor [hydrothermal vent metagenome]|uniref:Transcriptional factor n=1 Tax=hydrothermal vent metagenome TaxID=652676 RepID=A0A1W1CIN1_9ZZZZ